MQFLAQSRFTFPPELAKELEKPRKPIKLKKRTLTGMRQWQTEAKLDEERLRSLSLPRIVTQKKGVPANPHNWL